MSKISSLLAAFLAGVGFAMFLSVGLSSALADNDPPPETEVPEPPSLEKGPEVFKWNELDFAQTIPLEWGTVFSINRVEKSGESYTFWFLAMDGTLRGVTTHEFTGPNRASFFPDVYLIHRK